MKKITFLLIIAAGIFFIACKEKYSERFLLLTTPIWRADSLLANGVDASGAGQLLAKFVGDAKFNKDGTGNFGKFTGTWMLSVDEKYLTIHTDSLPLPIVTNIKTLTSADLKITTSVTSPVPNTPSIAIRMTFKAK